MTAENIFNWFLIISALHGFMFNVVLFFSRYRKQKSIIFLNLLVLSISLNNLQSWIIAKNFFGTYFFLNYLHIPWHFLIAPFFYMFLINYLEIFNQSRKLLKLLIPVFLIIIIIRIFFVILYKEKNDNNTVFLFEKYTSIEEIISLIISLSVFIYSFYIVKKKKKLFAKILTFDDLKWIYTFFKLGAFTYIFWVVALSITVYLNYSQFIFSYYPLRVLTTVLIYWIGYQSIIQLKLLNERKSLRELIAQNEKKTTYNDNAISTLLFSNKKKNINEKEFHKITVHIKQNKRFLLQKYTINNLSDELNISRNKLSSIINSSSYNNFSNYINSLRVSYAKILLTSKKFADYTIISIGLESGFSSKSSFYLVFKKHTNYTPSQFQQKFRDKL